jgi:hypothetical protein
MSNKELGQLFINEDDHFQHWIVGSKSNQILCAVVNLLLTAIICQKNQVYSLAQSD